MRGHYGETMNYKISIIIPVYRVEKYIERCCNSLFGMQFDDVEFLFVNDATPDNSVEVINNVLERYPSRVPHVRILTHDLNKGVACARNTGLIAATGEYVAFVDADDWIEGDMFERLYQCAESNHLDIVGCDWYLEFVNSRRYLKQPVYNNPKDCLKAMLAGEMRWFLWAFLIRRCLYTENNIRFSEGADIGEDMSVLIRCFSFAHSYYHLERPLYHYVRYNSGSLTSIDPKRQMELVKVNVDTVTDFIHGRYPGQYESELNFLKLNVKFPLLISDNILYYETWNNCFSEANCSIWKNTRQPFRNKLLQWSAMHHYYWVLKAYYRLLFKFVYGIIYR